MKTVGSILKAAREKKALSLEQVRKATKIHPRFLKALESGDYFAFSSSPHLKGFLRTYARFLELDEEEVMAFLRREYDEKNNQVEIGGVKALRGPRIFWTAGWVVSVFAAILIIAFLAYLFWGYQRYARAPLLVVDQPAADLTISEPSLEVAGYASQGAEVKLNGEKLFLSGEGKFTATITLSYGLNTLEFVATSPLGRETEVTRTVIVEAPVEEEEEKPTLLPAFFKSAIF